MWNLTMSEGTWLKGALHCHSKSSDGLLSPEDVARFYEGRGYKLLSITDHEKMTKLGSFKGVYVPGVEVSRGSCELGERYHILALGVEDPSIWSIHDAQSLIDHINGSGGLAFIAHPYWSNLTCKDLIALEGYLGIEIYNTGCDVEVAKGYSLPHWDSVLSLKKKIYGLAVDDVHRYIVPPIDADGGWIWINMDDLTVEGALNSLRAGKFYSSMGPKIVNFKYSSNSVFLESSPVNRLNLVAPNGRGISFSLDTINTLIGCWKKPEMKKICENVIVNVEHICEGDKQTVYLETKKDRRFSIEYSNEGITRFEAKYDINYSYFRIEVIDEEGRYAWLNPVINP